MQRLASIAAFLAILLLGLTAEASRADFTRVIGLPSPTLSGAPATRQDLEPFAVGDTVEIVARRLPPPGYLGGFALAPQPLARFNSASTPRLSSAAAVPAARRPVSLASLLRPRTVPVTRFSSVMQGVNLGTGAASSLAGLGLVGGLWGQRTAGYLLGAGAILGALWGGTLGAESPGSGLVIGPAGPAPSSGGHGSRPEDDPGAARPPR
jgi:hypothetical protein